MPASDGDHVTRFFESSLSDNSGNILDKSLSSLCDKILGTEIRFEKKDTVHIANLVSEKYIVLSTKLNKTSNEAKQVPVGKEDLAGPSLPVPEVVLYPRELVKTGWKSVSSVETGLYNLGNTCYMNSVLQALFHVPAFINWLEKDFKHFSACASTDHSNPECIICTVHRTLKMCRAKDGNAVKPFPIYSRLRAICKHFIPGNQEDAHEFLRYLIEGMEKSYIAKCAPKSLDNTSKETTPLHQIFGGYIRTEVTCLVCRTVSTTFQPFQDLMIDIRRVSTLDDALVLYFQKEKLDGENAYWCSKCKRNIAATKKYSIERIPNVLSVQLKRFDATGEKLNKMVSFSEHLDITRFTYQGGKPVTYRLVAVITHVGSTNKCGHYMALAESSSGVWYRFDDSKVRPISKSLVLGANAYIILYELEGVDKQMNRTQPSNKTSTVTSQQVTTSVNGKTVPSKNLGLPAKIIPNLPQTVCQAVKEMPSKVFSFMNSNTKKEINSVSSSAGNHLDLNVKKDIPGKHFSTVQAELGKFIKKENGINTVSSSIKSTDHGKKVNGSIINYLILPGLKEKNINQQCSIDSSVKTSDLSAATSVHGSTPKSLVPYESEDSSDTDNETSSKKENHVKDCTLKDPSMPSLVESELVKSGSLEGKNNSQKSYLQQEKNNVPSAHIEKVVVNGNANEKSASIAIVQCKTPHTMNHSEISCNSFAARDRNVNSFNSTFVSSSKEVTTEQSCSGSTPVQSSSKELDRSEEPTAKLMKLSHQGYSGVQVISWKDEESKIQVQKTEKPRNFEVLQNDYRHESSYDKTKRKKYQHNSGVKTNYFQIFHERKMQNNVHHNDFRRHKRPNFLVMKNRHYHRGMPYGQRS